MAALKRRDVNSGLRGEGSAGGVGGSQAVGRSSGQRGEKGRWERSKCEWRCIAQWFAVERAALSVLGPHLYTYERSVLREVSITV